MKDNYSKIYPSSTVIILLFILNLLLPQTVDAVQPQINDEFTVKAAYIYNFLSFISWNEQLPSENPETISITIIGKNDHLESFRTLNGRMFRGRVVILKIIDRIEDYSYSDIVYISQEYEGKYKEIINDINDSQAFLIGEDSMFIENGGMLSFVMNNRNVRFMVNAKNAEESGITISSQLLQLAQVVIR